jgi:transposase
MQAEALDTTVSDYNSELEIYKQRCLRYEQHIEEIKNNYEKSLKEYEYKYLELKEQYDLLAYKRFARSAEQLLADEKQPLLFAEGAKQPEADEDKPEELQTVASFKRKKAGRKPLGANLERRERIVDIPENEKTCACGAKLTQIGVETSEKLIIRPPVIYVDQIIRPKYACRDCEGTEDEDKPSVRIAPVEPSIIPRGIASPSLLSTVITQKFEMHLPYYRQEKQFRQIGAEISRQDMSNWQQQVYRRLKPLFDLLLAVVKSFSVLQMDETPVQVMGEEGRKDTQTSYMWLARGGPPEKRVVWYEYHPTRAAYNAKAFLEGYRGYLQTDGNKAYDSAAAGNPDIIQVGCFAHARRYFFEAEKISAEGKTAKEALECIRKLYRIEKELRNEKEGKKKSDEEFQKERKERAGPALADFKAWLLNHVDKIPPGSLLGEAIGYSLNQWDKLAAYLESPCLTPDNNAAERAIRPFVMGRKNWLFSQCPEGAKSSCGMYTLIETAKQNGLVPFNYLTALFEKAPYVASPQDWEKLLPWNIFKS